MKVAICSKYDKKEIAGILKDKGFKLVKKEPEMVVSYGGDGTVLYAEDEFPGVPKLVVKINSRTFRGYEYKLNKFKDVLDKVKEKEFSLVSESKVKAKHKKKTMEGLNEIQIRHKIPTKAIRFSVGIRGKIFKNLIGDGLIIATPYGSTGYYNSIGGNSFEKGLGLGFNNIHQKEIKSRILPEEGKIKVKIKRGPALLIKDNSKDFIELKKGDEVIVRKAGNKAKFVKMNKK